jgi:hypothetical protein
MRRHENRSSIMTDHATVAGQGDKNKKTKSKRTDPGCAEARPSTTEPAS